MEHIARMDRKRFRMLLGTFPDERAQDPLADAAIERGIECTRFGSGHDSIPRLIHTLFKFLRAERVDILCTHGYKPTILGLCAARLAHLPAIAISRGWTWESSKIRFYEMLERKALRFMDHVVAVSSGQRDKLLACGVRPEHLSVIRNAIDLQSISTKTVSNLRHELNIPDKSLLVVSAGRLSPEKNHAGMIEVARRVLSSVDDVCFAVFGEGFLRPELEARIASAGLAGRFFLPGFRTDLQSILNEIDIFMLPSFTEGLPNVALEAFAAGKPIVASAVGGTPEVVQDGISGFLTPPDDHDLMAQRLLLLIRDPELRKRMGDAGRTHVLREFGFEKQTELYEKLYRDLAG